MADKAFEEYGYVATLAKQVPELAALLRAALAKKWSADEFSRAVQDSKWWKNSADQVKQVQILKATKPGEYQAQRKILISKVQVLAAELGINVKGHIGGYADAAMSLGWDDAELKRHLASLVNIRNFNAGGDAGATMQQLRELRSQYGLGGNDPSVAINAKKILMGGATLDGIRAQLIQAAKSRYAGFAKELDEGQTMQQIADPYVQTIAQTLELAPGSVDFNSPEIQRALTARDGKTGAPSPMALWQVADQARHDPRYDHTKQAVNDAYTMLSQVGRSWGFKG